MTIDNLVIYSVASFGVAYILGHSGISRPFRVRLEPKQLSSPIDGLRAFALLLIECPACLGFWTGLASALWLFAVFPGHGAVAVLGTALYTCGSNLLLARLAGLYGAGT